jgi:hypothetical protein
VSRPGPTYMCTSRIKCPGNRTDKLMPCVAMYAAARRRRWVVVVPRFRAHRTNPCRQSHSDKVDLTPCSAGCQKRFCELWKCVRVLPFACDVSSDHARMLANFTQHVTCAQYLCHNHEHCQDVDSAWFAGCGSTSRPRAARSRARAATGKTCWCVATYLPTDHHLWRSKGKNLEDACNTSLNMLQRHGMARAARMLAPDAQDFPLTCRPAPSAASP